MRDKSLRLEHSSPSSICERCSAECRPVSRRLHQISQLSSIHRLASIISPVSCMLAVENQPFVPLVAHARSAVASRDRSGQIEIAFALDAPCSTREGWHLGTPLGRCYKLTNTRRQSQTVSDRGRASDRYAVRYPVHRTVTGG